MLVDLQCTLSTLYVVVVVVVSSSNIPIVTFRVTRLILFQHYIINFNCLSSLRFCLHLCRVWYSIQCLIKAKKDLFTVNLPWLQDMVEYFRQALARILHRTIWNKKNLRKEKKQQHWLTSRNSFSSFAIICSFLFSLASSSPVLNSMWWIFCL